MSFIKSARWRSHPLDGAGGGDTAGQTMIYHNPVLTTSVTGVLHNETTTLKSNGIIRYIEWKEKFELHLETLET
jgi:hypothetical protein